jgi:D-alanyl-D-alanine carboxypeptidase/D-alanyl-D-alanine-endopeptidase (penicillin-binding protein 4)
VGGSPYRGNDLTSVDYAPSTSRIDVGYTVCEFGPCRGGQQEGCVPENDQPMWPSSDEDSTSGAKPDQGRDAEATAYLPVPKPAKPAKDEGLTDQLAVPKITQSEQKTSWFRPNVPAVPPPLALPPTPPEPKQQQKPEPKPEPQPQEPEKRPEQKQQQQQQRPNQPPPPQQRPEPPRQEQQQQQRPDQQRQEQQQQPPRPDQQQQQRPDHRQPPPLARRLPPIPAAPHAVPMRIEPTGEQHPAEATTGADRDWPETKKPADDWNDDPWDAEATATVETVDPPKSGDTPAKPGHKRRNLLIGAFALLLVVALGVAAALPQVSNRLELPWAPNKPKGDAPEPVAVALAMRPPAASAPEPTADGVTKALSGLITNPLFTKLTGSVIDAESGAVLWDHSSAQPMTPASTTKLLTVAAALLTLDHGAQLSTKVVEGDQPGTVVLVGGGDPTLNSLPDGKDSLYTDPAHLDDLVAQVKAATGGKVQKVLLDVGLYTGPATGQGWDPTDAPSTFAAPMVPVMLDGGRTNPNDDHSMRVATPAMSAAKALAQRLGVQAQPVVGTAPKNAKVLGEVKSAPLPEMVNDLLQLSDNTLAEAVSRMSAHADGVDQSFAGAAKHTLDVLSRNGFDITGVQLNDSNGLSKLNKIPAKLLNQILAVAAGPDGKDPRTAKLRPLLGGLPVAGGSGTLSERYDEPLSSVGKGYLRAKTGTLADVNTLGGVVLDTDGRVLVFTMMSTGGGGVPDPVRAALDDLVAALRGCGCR